jgi:hypothetical protein
VPSRTTRSRKFAPRKSYVDPVGLQEAEKSMKSTVSNMDVEGVPLRVALKLLLRQLDLAYRVNDGEFVLLPGQVTVYVHGNFVGRMRLPLVAAGEPFVAGFGVDPQLQVSRRLVRKSRSVQGGNEILDYEFRIGLRNCRSDPVKAHLWDRLPKTAR